MSVCLQILNDFLTSLETYTTLEELREYYDREKLLNWLTRPTLNGGTISYAEIHSLETQEELDLAIDLLIACGIGNGAEQTQTVYARITGGR